MPHDFDAQRRETEAVFQLMASRQPLPKRIQLDLHFAPTRRMSEIVEFYHAAQDAGYDAHLFENRTTVELQVMIEGPTAHAIWQVERAATELALDYDMVPDGWGISTPMPVMSRLAQRVLGWGLPAA